MFYMAVLCFFSIVQCHVPILSTVNLLVLLGALKALFEDILFLLLIVTLIPTMLHFTPLHLPGLLLPILPFYPQMLCLGRGSPELTKEGVFSYCPHMIQCMLYEKLQQYISFYDYLIIIKGCLSPTLDSKFEEQFSCLFS